MFCIEKTDSHKAVLLYYYIIIIKKHVIFNFKEIFLQNKISDFSVSKSLKGRC